MNAAVNHFKAMLRGLRNVIGSALATPETDPQRNLGPLLAMPNPDPILRQMGVAEKAYAEIESDAHVLGDIRSIRGNFRSHEYRLNAGDEDDTQSMAAHELCEQWMERCQPNPLADWLEVMWQMSSAFLYGYRPHELVWQLQDGNVLPGQIIDRPNRRFTFNAHGEPLLISAGNLQGKPVEPWQFVISRHMPSAVNPYGVAVLSRCFWLRQFKTGGWRFFVKYCERHGLPWPVGRYPLGTTDDEQDVLAEALSNMIESGYVVVPEGTGVELLTPTGNGSVLPQENLIALCNREMSKALTGQAMVAELQGTGARAASETALKRQESIDDSVRDIAAQSMNAVFRWITLFNFGDGIAPPTLEFFKHENAGKERAETYQLAADMGAHPSKSAMLEELGIPKAETDDDALLPTTKKAAEPLVRPEPAAKTTAAKPASTNPAADDQLDLSGIAGFEFLRAAGMTEDEAIELATVAADRAIEDHMIAPVATMLARYEADGKTLAEFKADLEGMVGAMDDEALREVIERAFSYATLAGAATRAA